MLMLFYDNDNKLSDWLIDGLTSPMAQTEFYNKIIKTVPILADVLVSLAYFVIISYC